jgi:hypothetical protein
VIRTFVTNVVALFAEWWAHRRSTMSRDWVRAQRQQAINKSAEVDGVSWNWPVRREGE